ncbi:hypothetical protein [Catellatospora methionotrophica]|uniref:hypothetical protein n=1 Tax=Catellatospora methionotrophica TaxID=121620 RepID=UPI0033EF3428
MTSALSNAITIYARASVARRPEAVRAELGTQADELLAKINQLRAEIEPTEQEWKSDSLSQMTERATERLRAHPELTEEAVRALVGVCSYAWR